MYRAHQDGCDWQVAEDRPDGTTRTILRVASQGVRREQTAAVRSVAVRVAELLNTHGLAVDPIPEVA
jgi:hypothetical protein